MAHCARELRSPYHRYADHRYFIGTLCIKLAFRFGFGDFFRAAADGTDHHIAESRIVPESGRSEEGSRPALMMSCVPVQF